MRNVVIILILIMPIINIDRKFQTMHLRDEPKDDCLEINKINDFEITGVGASEEWEKAEWTIIPHRQIAGEGLKTKVKILYSESGIYFLFHCEDKKLTATMNEDFMDLWTEDVVEVFLWPDEAFPVYFEYEISPLNYELPIIVSNENGDLVRWQPFHYDQNRRTRHATSIEGGSKESNAIIKGWIAEFFIPYTLLRPLNNIPPQSGTKWRANFYRVDYDGTEKKSWSWKLTTKTFHDYEKFGIILFK